LSSRTENDKSVHTALAGLLGSARRGRDPAPALASDGVRAGGAGVDAGSAEPESAAHTEVRP
jgi:hypothetical protein